MITAEPGTLLAHICRDVDRMEPGQAFKIDRHTLSDIPTFWHKGAIFTAADRVLENIVGSAYTHSYRVDPMDGGVSFYRHEDTGARRYSSPDRR